MIRGWLLDTNVVGELLKGARGNQAVIDWIKAAEENRLYLSVITLGEIAKGIGLAEARGRDMRRQRDFLHRALPERFGERVLPFDTEAAIVWGRLLQGCTAIARRSGRWRSMPRSQPRPRSPR